ncbi:monofunctional biosynthetic peptidoglycan transglycosylase [Shimia sp. CNT1-13L.2]|uniref:monofunctional biosynthetic peptidoglycan transglycosylase n=1 Tax=Shimia sp. CNT1-13L.2 TaxID=2959663 RepID=UPI0020CEBD96|nr:monofunctional biosynthetic peptidoglycan transglycosylase [Shimia sp. CNT1-13L.2]MCP9482486.1 monofunctional biosynthetic peptidoglycan transglycosylase [Shimia sp. CNT1-13L.2]
MAKKKGKSAPELTLRQQVWRRVRRALRRGTVWGVSLTIFAVLIYIVINPPMTWTMYSEKQRLGRLDKEWVPIEEVAPVMLRAVVAAEDANFCEHWGFDIKAIRAALADGSGRGASTLSQQTVKNVYLWQGRSWGRKALEALLTPLVEIAWSKRRILEVYVNVAEFDEGVFGVEAASRHYFKVGPEKLTPAQAAQLAAVLPSPKTYSASRPGKTLRARAARIRDGAETIRRDGRSRCFED